MNYRQWNIAERVAGQLEPPEELRLGATIDDVLIKATELLPHGTAHTAIGPYW